MGDILTTADIRRAYKVLAKGSPHASRSGFYTLRVHPIQKRSWELRDAVCKTDARLHWRQIHAQAWAEVEGWA